VILLLDAGNSRIKWGTWHAGAWRGHGAVPVAEPEGLAVVLAEARPSWVGISCVAGAEVRARLATLFAGAGMEPHWLVPAAVGHGLVNGYVQPETLGADRYAALIACVRAGHGPCVVASVGTAVTIDALSGNGEFLGGMILPGANLMRRALGSGTAGVAAQDGTWQPFPRRTGDAVETGIWTAISASVGAMQARLSGGPERAATVVTGGDAAILAARLSADVPAGPVITSEYLVLEGLLWVARDLDVPGV
jgi:type III pantothenate kinase